MNKKGFTVIEILAVITILAVIMLIAIPGVSDLQARFKKNYYEKLDDTVLTAAKDYFNYNKSSIPNGDVGITVLNLNVLTRDKFLESILPYNVGKDGEQCQGYVVLAKINAKKVYTNCMRCDVDGVTEYETDALKQVSNPENRGICSVISSMTEISGKDTLPISKTYDEICSLVSCN